MPTEDRGARRLQALAETGHAFADASFDIAALLDVVTQSFARLIGDGCYVRLVADDGVSLVPVATYHPDPEIEGFLHETSDKLPLRVGEGVAGRAVETGEPVLVPVVDFTSFAARIKPEFVPIFSRIGFTSLIVVPLRSRARKLGFIGLVRNGVDRPAYTEDDLALAQDVADRAALAIDNARLVDELEGRVAARTAQLEAANAELEAFSYSVSHDLRAPLRAIDGFSQILEEDYGPALVPEARRVIGVIRKNSQRMGQLIDDLLRFSRLGRHALRFTAVAMGPLAHAVAEEMRSAEPDRAIEVRIGELATLDCDRELIRQVWVNLIGNAVKYTRGVAQAIITVACTTAGNEVRFTVTDNGSGFDPRYADKLFKVFQRLHGNTEFEGTGVGLALVARIVGRHGGRVWADGSPHHGATFGFSLPRTRAP